ncbi:MAG: phosphotransferase family protein [bacterium]|jgi:5-methylthioribose kinase
MTYLLDTKQRVLDYLIQSGHVVSSGDVSIEELQGGVSNYAWCIHLHSGAALVIKQAREKLAVKVDWFCSPERVHREALGIRYLSSLLPNGVVPALLFEDQENHLLAMEAVPQPHENWKQVLLRGELHLPFMEDYARILSTIHRESHQRRAELEPLFSNQTFFENLRLEPYYLYTATQVPDASSFLHSLITETRSSRLALVHGDYSPKNVLIYNQHLILLDHEVIHWGDPAFDVGFCLTHFLSKAHHLPASRDQFIIAVERFCQYYFEEVRNNLPDPDYENRTARHTLACMLARVAGRSPLEYLSHTEQQRQQQHITEMMHHPPASLFELVWEWKERIRQNA